MRFITTCCAALCVGWVLAPVTVRAAADEQPLPSLMRLPAGHPDISDMKPGGAASTRPAATSGKLAIRAIQGTAGAAAPNGDKVVIELYHRDQPIKKMEATLDEHGVVVLEDVPLMMPVTPMVTVVHADAEYQTVGQPLDGAHPEQTLEVKVYEPTDQEPAWSVGMRHLIVHEAAEGLHVTEMLVVSNPSDRAWRGGAASADGSRPTLALPLPADAMDVSVSAGFHSCCTRVENGKLVSVTPLLPGNVQYQYSYILPPKDGQATIALNAPAPVSHLMVVVPEGLGQVQAQGLEASGSMQAEGVPKRLFKATNMTAGQQASITLSGIALASAAPAAGAAAASTAAPKVVAVVGGALVLGIGALVMLMKARGAKA